MLSLIPIWYLLRLRHQWGLCQALREKTQTTRLKCCRQSSDWYFSLYVWASKVYLNFYHKKTINFHISSTFFKPSLRNLWIKECIFGTGLSIACGIKVMDVTDDGRIEDVWSAPVLSISVPVWNKSHTSILTRIFCSDLGRRGTGLSHPDTVTGQDPELIFHPSIQTHHGCSQSVPIDHFRNCGEEQQ